MDRGVNDAGRGLNLVVIDAKTRQVMRCGHFDTYAEGNIFESYSSFFSYIYLLITN